MRWSFDVCLSAAIATAVVAVVATSSCSSNVDSPGPTTATSSSSGVGGNGGAGGAGGASPMSSSTGCMATIGGCYDAMECNTWAACECPNLPCDADCVAYRMCIGACADAACLDTCRMQHTDGATQQDAIVKCAHCGADPCFGSLCNNVMPPITCP